MNRHIIVLVVVFLLMGCLPPDRVAVYVKETWNRFVLKTFYNDPRIEASQRTASFNLCMHENQEYVDSGSMNEWYAKFRCADQVYRPFILDEIFQTTGNEKLWRKQVWYHIGVDEILDPYVKSFLNFPSCNMILDDIMKS